MTDGMFQVLPSFDCEGSLEIFEIRSGVIESICLYQNLTIFVWSWLSWLFSVSLFSVCSFVCLVICWCYLLFPRAFVIFYPLPQLRAGENLFLSLSLSTVLFYFCHPRLPLGRVSDSLRFVPKYPCLKSVKISYMIGNFTLRTSDPSIWLCCILGQVFF